MLRRLLFALTAFMLLTAAAAPKALAPATLSHPIAMFLANMSSEGKQKVTFKAAAIGRRFFYEEAAGVTVYAFDGNASYRKEMFLKGYTLARALKKYGQ